MRRKNWSGDPCFEWLSQQRDLGKKIFLFLLAHENITHHSPHAVAKILQHIWNFFFFPDNLLSKKRIKETSSMPYKLLSELSPLQDYFGHRHSHSGNLEHHIFSLMCSIFSIKTLILISPLVAWYSGTKLLRCLWTPLDLNLLECTPWLNYKWRAAKERLINSSFPNKEVVWCDAKHFLQRNTCQVLFFIFQKVNINICFPRELF